MLRLAINQIATATAEKIDKQQVITGLQTVNQMLEELEPGVIDGSASDTKIEHWVEAIARKIILALQLGEFDLIFSMFLKAQEVNYRLEAIAKEREGLRATTDVWCTSAPSICNYLMKQADSKFADTYQRFFDMRDKMDATNASECKKLEAQVVHIYHHQLSALKKHQDEGIKLNRFDAAMQANQSLITTVLQLRPYEKITAEDQVILTECQNKFISYIQVITPKCIDIIMEKQTGKSELEQAKQKIIKNIMILLSSTPPKTEDLEHVLFLIKCIDDVCNYSQSKLTVIMLSVILIHAQDVIAAIENSQADQLKSYPFHMDMVTKLKSKVTVIHRECSKAYKQWYASYSVSQKKDVSQESKEDIARQVHIAKETEFYLNILLARSYQLSQTPYENMEEQEFVNNAIIEVLNDRQMPKTISWLFGEKILEKSNKILDTIKIQREQNLLLPKDAVVEVKDDKAAKIVELKAQVVSLKAQLDSKISGYDDYQQWVVAALHRLHLSTNEGESKHLASSLQDVEDIIAYAESKMALPATGKDDTDGVKYSQKYMMLTLYIADVFEKQNRFLKSIHYYRKGINLNRAYIDKLRALVHKDQPNCAKLLMLEKSLHSYLANVYLLYVSSLEAKLQKRLTEKPFNKINYDLLNKYNKAIRMSKIIPAEILDQKDFLAKHKKKIEEMENQLASQIASAILQQNIGYIQEMIIKSESGETVVYDAVIEKYFSAHRAIIEKSILGSSHRLLIKLYIFLLLPEQKDGKWKVAELMLEIFEKNNILTQYDGMLSLNNYGLEDFKELIRKIFSSVTIHLNASAKAKSEMTKIITLYHNRKVSDETEINDKLRFNLVAKFKAFVPADDKNAPGYSAANSLAQLTALANNCIAEMKCTLAEKRSLAAKIHQWSLTKIEIAAAVPAELLRKEYFLKAKDIIDNANNDKQSKIVAELERVAKAKRDKQLQKLNRKKHANAQPSEAKDREVQLEVVATLDHTKEQIEHLCKIKKAYDDFVSQKLNDVDASFDCQVNVTNASITLGLALSTTHTAAFHVSRLRVLKEDFIAKLTEHCFTGDAYSVDRLAKQYAISIKVADLNKANQGGLDRRFLVAFKSLMEDTTARHEQVEKELIVQKKVQPIKSTAIMTTALGQSVPSAIMPATPATQLEPEEKKSNAVEKDAATEQSLLNAGLLGQLLLHNLTYRKFSTESEPTERATLSCAISYF